MEQKNRTKESTSEIYTRGHNTSIAQCVGNDIHIYIYTRKKAPPIQVSGHQLLHCHFGFFPFPLCLSLYSHLESLVFAKNVSYLKKRKEKVAFLCYLGPESSMALVS